MAGIDRRHAIAAEYARIQREIADHAVVDAAEDILGHAWIAHLEQLRHAAADAVASAARNVHGARCLVHACQVTGKPRHLAHAQDLLKRSQRDLARSMAESGRILSEVDERLGLLSRATAERVRRRRADLSRLHATRAAALDGAAGPESSAG